MTTTVKRSLCMGVLLAAVMLSACAGSREPGSTGDTPSAPNSVGRYKVGKPYQIKGTWYKPREDFGYEEVGMASWYGRQFHGRRTANGEIYDMNDMTAAHRTLPLPSVVRVTNLDNGRSVKLRVNDRGPFARGRIIDVSRRAAKMLGFKNKGVTRVRVEIVVDESRALAERGGSGGRMSNQVSEVGLMPDPAVAALNRKQLTTGRTQQPSRTVTMAPVSTPAAARSMAVTPDPTVAALNRKQLATAGIKQPSRAVTMAPVSTPAAARSIVVTPVPAPTRFRTYIQAGSFSNRDNAHRVRSRLSGLGPVEVRTLQVGGRGFYRVRVGPLSSNEQAERVLADVIRAGYPTSRIVSE